MSNSQNPYEGYAYPTEFQGSVGRQADTYFSPSRSPPPSALGGGGVGSTGLTRRSPQHTGNVGSANLAAAATVNTSASPNNNNSNSNAGQYPGSYGYFHGHGNSIDVNSGYNSDAGSSVSNQRYFVPVPSGVAVAGLQDGADGLVAAVAPDVSPMRPPQPPRFGGGGAARHASAVPGVVAVEGTTANSLGSSSGNVGVFHPGGGRAGSAEDDSMPSSASLMRAPVAPPAFLPSRPFMQTPPLSSSAAASPLGGHAHTHQPHNPPQQPYMVPMPSLTSAFQGGPRGGSGRDMRGASTPPESAGPLRLPHMVSPSTAGPRMPASAAAGDYGQPYGANTAAGAAASGGGGRGGFFSRMVAQVIPTFDDGTSGGAVGSAEVMGSVPRERPPHQLRFGNPADDLPLLEELGIFPRHIVEKARAVLNPFKTMSVDAAKDTDLAGPLLFAFSLALLLSLRGKIQFSAIYGLFVLGVALFKVLLSLMQPKGGGAPLQFVVSTVGYGLLPTVLLAIVRTTCSKLLTRRSLLPLTLLMILWSAWCGSVLVAKGLGMQEQRYLVLYPMVLFYAAFDALTVF